jgi:hypothetical protein
MNQKRVYIWQLAVFLTSHDKVMSGKELADHLNRNDFLTEYGAEYQGARGTYTLIEQTYRWLDEDLGLPKEAGSVAKAFVKPDGSYAYE